MTQLFFVAVETLLLVSALSMDAFTASLAYGTQKIYIPWSSAAAISFICSGVVTVSLLIGRVIGPYIPEGLPTWIGFCILLILGTIKLFDSSIKAYIRRHRQWNKRIRFSLCNLRFILTVYADPEEADQDASKELSLAEAISLALALSIDGLAAGFGAGLTDIRWGWVALLSFFIGLASVWSGQFVGRRLAEKSSLDLSWLGGAMLMILAFMKL